MTAGEPDIRELLSSEPGSGILRFGGQRVLLFDAVALGLLRRLLIEELGAGAARGLLTRFGFAHGWRTAESTRGFRLGGGHLHMLQGWVRFERVPPGPDAPFAEAIWHESYEAEQHESLLGRSDEPVCWTLTGYASGYMSQLHGTDVVCIETSCVGRGDPVCRMVGRPRAAWGPEIETVLPFFDHACIDGALRQATDALKRAEAELGKKKRQLARIAGSGVVDPSGIVAASEPMRRLLELARRAAKVDATVLVTGETGAGKERVARLLHDESPRASGPFVTVDCGALPESLIESELFGHARGAFTGAAGERAGLFEAAHGGTILLDEIGELSPAMQVKLLRVLQTHEVRRIGENRSRKVDVRTIAATNKNLKHEVEARRFREDLYYRLRVIELSVPPLRERREDILPLAQTFLGEKQKLDPEAADQLVRHAWPGNVRELESAMLRATALSRGSRIEPADLPEEVRLALPTARATGSARTLADVERQYVLAVLEKHDGHRARTAAELGIGVATLYRKLARWGV